MGNIRRSIHVGVLAPMSVAVVGACELSDPLTCTEIGCVSEVALTIKAPRWQDGRYTVTISESGRTFNCSVELGATPGPGGQAGQSGVTSGTTDSDAVGQCGQTSGTPAENGERPHVYFSDALHVEVPGTPSELGFTLDFSDQRLLDETLEPTYTKSYPNGYECDKGHPCLNATAEYDVEVR